MVEEFFVTYLVAARSFNLFMYFFSLDKNAKAVPLQPFLLNRMHANQYLTVFVQSSVNNRFYFATVETKI